NIIKFSQPQDPSLRQFPFVILERSEESKGNCLRSRMTAVGFFLNLMPLGYSVALLHALHLPPNIQFDSFLTAAESRRPTKGVQVPNDL
ncbi:MAG: hypothetical protein IIV03_07100, partial [Clostridia bacterium]|nr:hypothetical protein [Clostridia bacterium]